MTNVSGQENEGKGKNPEEEMGSDVRTGQQGGSFNNVPSSLITSLWFSRVTVTLRLLI